jgi:hypothetical protein
MPSNPKLLNNYVTLLRCAIPLSFFFVSIMFGTAKAEIWIGHGKSGSCYVECLFLFHRDAVMSGAYTRNGNYFYVCRGNAQGEGYRPGYNLGASNSCTVGWGGSELSVGDYDCLCH